MPYPPRTTVFFSAFQAKPTRGAKLFRSGFIRLLELTPPNGAIAPGVTSAAEVNPGVRSRSRFASRLLASV